MSQKQTTERKSRQLSIAPSLADAVSKGDESVQHAEDLQVVEKRHRRKSVKKKLELPAESQQVIVSDGEMEEEEEVQVVERKGGVSKGKGKGKMTTPKKKSKKREADAEETDLEEEAEEIETEDEGAYREELHEREEETDVHTASKRLSVLQKALGGRKLDSAELETALLSASTKNIIPAGAMKRILKELINEVLPGGRLTTTAFEMLCAGAEEALTNTFFVSNVLTRVRKTSTVNAGDVKLAAIITGMVNNGRGLDLHTTELGNVLEAYGLGVNKIPEIYRPKTPQEMASSGFTVTHCPQEDMAAIALDRKKQKAAKDKKRSLEKDTEAGTESEKKPKKKAKTDKTEKSKEKEKEKRSKKSTSTPSKSKK